MKNASTEVDVYIARSAEFAQPILKKVRQLFHKAYPKIEETIKWGVPHFEYKGIVGSMAGFKQHVSFGFWKGKLLSDPRGLFTGVGNTEMGALRVSSLKEMPADKVLLEYIKEAVQLNENEIKPPRAKPRKPAAPLSVPSDLASALDRNPTARATFESFSPSHRKEYIEWITEAKQAATREKRLATALEWMAEGKPRNWKYMKGK